MKINKHLINQRVAESLDAGLSVAPTSVHRPSALAVAINHAIHSHPFIWPVFACALPGMVFASPEGGEVVAGSASITSPDVNTTLITQTTAQVAIDWQRFNIGTDEYVQFAQPDSSSIALNRVIGGDPSEILGNLSANGQVFLVNPNGIYFGNQATVDVGGIVASVLDISTDDFMAGNYIFSKADGAQEDIGVVNDGLITARDNGYVVLMGDYAHNNNIISARLGTVALAVGNRVTMDVKGNGLVSVAIEEETFSELAGVDNTGEIMASGGRVIMSAKIANDLIDTAINNEGLVVANSITERDGLIFLTATGGDVVNSGTLDASAEDGSNADGGGVLVYSDKNVSNASGAVISATGDGNGEGGIVRVIAEDFMNHQSGARVDVTSDAGDGGFVELSGHGTLAIRGEVDIGAGGDLVIDPGTLTITNSNNTPGFTTGGTSPSFSNGFVGKGFVESQLNSNTNVTLVANNNIVAAGGSLGSTTATFAINATGTGDLSIINGIVEPGGTLGACTMTGVCLPGGSNTVTQGATGSISLGTVSININGGLNIAGGSTAGSVSIGAINAGGNVSISAGGDINLLGDMSAPNIALNADIDMNGVGDVNIIGSTIESRTIQTPGAMNVTGANFNIIGADFGTGAVSNGTAGSLTSVIVQANTLTASVSNQVVISGGRVNIVDSNRGILSGGRDVSVVVNATNDINITATDLVVRGNSVTANGSSFSTFITANGDATLSAGNNININVSGNLTVAGGIANATHSFYSTGYSRAYANASINAGNNVNITNVGGAMTIQAGPAGASMNSIVSGTGSAVALANASVSGTNITVGAAGSLNVLRGNASATIQSFSSGNYTASASANASLVATQDISLSVTGNINLTGGTGASSNTASVTANANGAPGAYNITANANTSIKGTNVTIDTTSGSLALAGGNANAVASSSSAGDAAITHNMNASATVELSATGQANINVNGNINVTKGTETATAATLPDVITANAAAIVSAAGMYMSAGNNMDLQTASVTVGSGTVAGINGDALTLAFLTANGITLPTTPNPNAKFSAGGVLNLGTVSMDGDVPYLWLEADTTNLTGLLLPNASDVVVQFSPYTLTASIGIEDVPDTSQVVNYNNFDHFGVLPGTTVIIGSSQYTGEITIGNLNDVDIGGKNLVAVTASKITSIDNVISTGIVAELIVGQYRFGSEFVSPVLKEVEIEVGSVEGTDVEDEKEKKKNLVKDDESEINMCEAS